MVLFVVQSKEPVLLLDLLTVIMGSTVSRHLESQVLDTNSRELWTKETGSFYFCCCFWVVGGRTLQETSRQTPTLKYEPA